MPDTPPPHYGVAASCANATGVARLRRLTLDGASLGDVASALGGDGESARVRVERLPGGVVPRDPRASAPAVAA